MKAAKFTLMFLACSAALPALAQNSSPQCGSTNFDQSRNIFTVMNPAADAVNQQCFVTVLPSGAVSQTQGPYLVEGHYIVELSGGGGGGGGGSNSASKDHRGGDGGGGASAALSRTVQYLSPGVYKLTMGTGGDGGRANGGRTEDGNPTSLTNASTGQLIAGFPGADVWTQHSRAAGSGHGGVAAAGASSGQDGQISAGGSGGAGDSAGRNTLARIGDRGRDREASDGGRGGHGFIRVALQTAAAPAAPTGAVAQGSAQEPTPAPIARPMRRDRN